MLVNETFKTPGAETRAWGFRFAPTLQSCDERLTDRTRGMRLHYEAIDCGGFGDFGRSAR